MSSTTPHEALAVSQTEKDMHGKLAAIDRSQAVAEFTLDGRVLRANANYLRLFGYVEDEVVGQHHRMFCRDDLALSAEYAEFWAALQRGEFRSGVFERVANDGHSVYLQGTYNPVLDAQGQPVSVLKFASDITASKAKALEDDAKIAAIGRSQGVIEFDLSGAVISANDNFLKLMDYTLDEVLGQHHRMFVEDAEAQNPAYRQFWQKLGRGEYDAGEYLRFGKNGKAVWIQASYNPVLDLDGHPVKVVKFCTDITAAKLQALENASRMDAVSTSSCMMELAPDGAILAVNAHMCRALGYDDTDLRRKNVDDLVFEEDLPSTLRINTWATLRAGKAVTEEQRRAGKAVTEEQRRRGAVPR